MREYINDILDKRIRRRIKKNIGKKIGCGLDGEVYEYGKSRAIKIGYLESPIYYMKLLSLIEIAQKGEDGLVKVYEHGNMRSDGFEYYYLIMERLNKIKNISYDEFYMMKHRRISDILDMRMKKLLLQSKRIERKHKIYYYDLHINNIMKTNKGEYKLIDLESYIERGENEDSNSMGE